MSLQSEKQTPHSHHWKDVEPDFSKLGSIAYIEWAILGQICECGMRRIYQGPAYGWAYLSPIFEWHEPQICPEPTTIKKERP